MREVTHPPNSARRLPNRWLPESLVCRIGGCPGIPTFTLNCRSGAAIPCSGRNLQWEGESVEDTVILCDTIAYTGEFFRVTCDPSARTRTGALQVERACSVRLRATPQLQFDAHQRRNQVMRRRDISKVLLASSVGSVLLQERAEAQTCNPPCYARTAAEIAAGVTPVNYAYVPGDVRRYGAMGDGSTNDSSAIQNALNANSGAAIYLIPGAMHRCVSGFSAPLDTDIVFNRATLDFSAATLSGSGLITSIGSLGSSLGGGLASTVTAGAVSATLNSAPSLSPGDLLILRNPADSSWNADRSYYRQGEFLIVKSVSGTMVTFSSAVIDTYVASCTLHKVTSTSTRLVGPGMILGNTADTTNLPTIYIQYGRDCAVEGIRFRNTTSTCLELSTCYEFRAQIDTGKYLADAGSIQSSGIIAGGQKGRIYDSVLHASRHGASTGGGGEVVSRYVIFDHCDIASRQNYAADFHGAAERCGYYNCRIDGSVNLSGDKNDIIECDITANSGLLINMEANLGISHTVARNRFTVRSSAQYVLDANASTDINANTTRSGTFRFKDNEIVDESSADQSYLFIRNNGSTATLSLEITGNSVRKTNATYYGNLLGVSVVSGSNFSRLTYLGQIHDRTGFGIVANIDTLCLSGSLGLGTANSASPAFGAAVFEPSEFWFEKKLNLGTPGTVFSILGIGTGNSFLPTASAARADTDVTATTGQYFSIGVDGTIRRADFGSSTNAAASSKHSKNSKLLFNNHAEATSSLVVAGEVLSLISTASNLDGTATGNSIGGANQSITVRIHGRMIGALVNLP